MFLVFPCKNNRLRGCSQIKAMYNTALSGGVAEWSIATVLKTVECNSSQGSNPCPSAIYSFCGINEHQKGCKP